MSAADVHGEAPIGVSVSFARYLLEEYLPALEDGLEYTTKEFCDRIVFPSTEPTQCAFLDLLPSIYKEAVASGSKHVDPQRDHTQWVGRASVFISHAWAYKFVDPLRIMVEYGEQAPDSCFWFDVFINNQHTIAAQVDFHWLCNTFKSSIQKIGTVLLILGPWNDPLPLTRCWCLWELLCAIELKDKVNFQVQLPKGQRHEFQENLSDNFDAVIETMARVDVAKAQAYNQKDRELIMDAIGKTIGVNQMNMIIKERMRAWFLQACQEILVDLNSQKDSRDELQYARLARHVAIVLSNVYDQTDDALALHMEVKSIYEKRQNEENLAYTLNDIAGIVSRDSVQEGLRWYERSLELYIKTFGNDRPQLAVPLGNMASNYEVLNDFTTAKRLYEQVLKLCEDNYGELHTSTAHACVNLAGTLLYVDNEKDRSVALIKRALKTYLELLGEKTTEVADCYSRIAASLSDEAQYDESLMYSRKALNIVREIYGETHISTAYAYKSVANAFLHAGKLSEAVDNLLICLEIAKVSLGEDSIKLAGILSELCDAYRFEGTYSEAIRHGKRAVAISEQRLGTNNDNTANCHYVLAGAYCSAGLFKDSIDHFLRARDIFVTVFHEKHDNVARTEGFIALAYLGANDLDPALRHGFKSLELIKSLRGERTPEAANARGIVAKILLAQKKFDEAIAQLKIAEEIQVSLQGEEHPFTTYTFDTMGRCLTAKGDAFEAIVYLKRALRCREVCFGPRHDESGRTHGNLAEAFSCSGDSELALFHADLCYDILQETLGADHRDTIEAKERQARLDSNQAAVVDLQQDQTGIKSDCEARLDENTKEQSGSTPFSSRKKKCTIM